MTDLPVQLVPDTLVNEIASLAFEGSGQQMCLLCLLTLASEYQPALLLFLKEIKIGFEFFMNYLLVPKSI